MHGSNGIRKGYVGFLHTTITVNSQIVSNLSVCVYVNIIYFIDIFIIFFIVWLPFAQKKKNYNQFQQWFSLHQNISFGESCVGSGRKSYLTIIILETAKTNLLGRSSSFAWTLKPIWRIFRWLQHAMHLIRLESQHPIMTSFGCSVHKPQHSFCFFVFGYGKSIYIFNAFISFEIPFKCSFSLFLVASSHYITQQYVKQ